MTPSTMQTPVTDSQPLDTPPDVSDPRYTVYRCTVCPECGAELNKRVYI